MALFDLTDVALERALAGAAQRQSLIANNLANASTPGFKRSDLDFQSTLADALGSGDEQAVASTSFAPTVDQSTGSADGNNVDLDAEMANLNENAATYQALAAIEKARLSMLQTAIGAH